MKARHFESHKSFCKLSLKIHYQKIPALFYLMEFYLNLKYKKGLNGNKTTIQGT
jgi:hypothetical protein